MLLRRDSAVRTRVATIFLYLSLVSGIPLAFVYLGSLTTAWDWPPSSSGAIGLASGIAVGLIVCFEMLLTPRKWLRGYRLFAAQLWLRWHVRIGFVSLPLVLIHSGFHSGGILPATTLLLFLVVFVSGVWGLIVQQWLPTRLLQSVPQETIQAETDIALERQANEAEQILTSVGFPTSGPDRLRGDPDKPMDDFAKQTLMPFLRGVSASSPLQSVVRGETIFASIQLTLPALMGPAMDRLRAMVDLRRQWVLQARIQFWLHNWLLVHLPVSVAMSILMVLHAVRALKYW